MKLQIIILSFLISKITLPYIKNLLIDSKFVKKNYNGNFIPSSMGILYIINIIILMPVLLVVFKDMKYLLLVTSLLIMGFVGLIDDFIDDRKTKGFKGHIKELFNNRLTTGGLKAIIGGTIALIISIAFSRDLIDIFINTLLVALFTNFINLTDLRPGRALKVFTMFAIIFILTLNIEVVYILIITLGITFAYFPYDVKGLTMIGDTGSNTLGITLGAGSVFLPIIPRLILLFILLIIHFYAEKYSISNLILRNRLLKYIDDLGK